MLWGINLAQYSTITANAQGFTSTVGYDTPSAGTNGVPATWASCNVGSAQPFLVPMECFRPDLATTFAGVNDANIVTFLSGAPSGALVTPWHESNDPSVGFPGNAAMYRDICRYIKNLVDMHQIPVLVGQKFGHASAGSAHNFLQDWVVPGMDWYGIDSYQHSASDTPDSLFGTSLADIYARSGKLAGISETNSSINIATWLPQVWAYATENNIPFLQTWWGVATFTYTWSATYTAQMEQMGLNAAMQHLAQARIQ